MARKKFSAKPKAGDRFNAPDFTPPDAEKMRPKFCLALMQGEGCVSACTKDEQAAFADTLRRLSQLTWSQIRQCDRHGLGSEIIDRSSLLIRIPNEVTEDVNILAFRFFAKAPMLCYKVREVLHIFWLDRDFTAYKH
jgi:hypothetical protein